MATTFDQHKNLARGTIAIGPAPPLTGLTLTLAAGDGARFAIPPFNLTVWPPSVDPTGLTAEIVRVGTIAGDQVTLIGRAQEYTAAIPIAAGYQIADTVTNKVLSDAAGRTDLSRLDSPNTFTQPQEIQNMMSLRDLSSPVDSRLWRFRALQGKTTISQHADSGALKSTPLTLDTLGALAVLGPISEKGRLTPMGSWIDVPYNAANFTATPGMTWTVDPADVVSFAYTLVGQTLSMVVHLITTTPGGTAGLELFIAIPGGFVPARTFQTPIRALDGGAVAMSFVVVTQSIAKVSIQRSDGAKWNTGGPAAQKTQISGVLTIPIL